MRFISDPQGYCWQGKGHYALAFLIGISMTQSWSILPTSMVITCVAIVAALLLIIACYWRLSIMAYVAWIMLGWAWLFSNATPILAWHLPSPFIGQTCLTYGEIVSEPITIGHRQRFIMALHSLQCGQQHMTFDQPKRVLLNWYSMPKQVRVMRTDHWRLTIKLKPGWGKANPGSFDSEKWLLTQRVHYVGYVINSIDNQQQVGSNQHVIRQHISQWRIDIQQYLRNALSTSPGRQLQPAEAGGLIIRL